MVPLSVSKPPGRITHGVPQRGDSPCEIPHGKIPVSPVGKTHKEQRERERERGREMIGSAGGEKAEPPENPAFESYVLYLFNLFATFESYFLT